MIFIVDMKSLKSLAAEIFIRFHQKLFQRYATVRQYGEVIYTILKSKSPLLQVDRLGHRSRKAMENEAAAAFGALERVFQLAP